MSDLPARGLNPNFLHMRQAINHSTMEVVFAFFKREKRYRYGAVRKFDVRYLSQIQRWIFRS